MSAAADHRFAQLDIVGLTLALATMRSSVPNGRSGPRLARSSPEASAAAGHRSAIRLDDGED